MAPIAEAKLISPCRAYRDPGILAADESRPATSEQGKDEKARGRASRKAAQLFPAGASSQEQIARDGDEVRQKEGKRIRLGQVCQCSQKTAGSALPRRARVVCPDHDSEIGKQ